MDPRAGSGDQGVQHHQTRCKSEAEQEAFGGRLAQICPTECVIFLVGDLGAGKTTLVRGFLRGLGYQGAVRSPTYTLIETYSFAGRSCCHLDLYRLSDPEELDYLGLRDLLGPDTLLLVEWPERGAGGLPEPDLWIHIRYRGLARQIDLDAASNKGEGILRRILR